MTTASEVNARLEVIKTKMPKTYAAIQAKAKEIGTEAFALVKRSLRGEANAFYAMERGHVVGTPFNMPEVTADVAAYMVRFGADFVCIWSAPAGKGSDAAH